MIHDLIKLYNDHDKGYSSLNIWMTTQKKTILINSSITTLSAIMPFDVPHRKVR